MPGDNAHDLTTHLTGIDSLMHDDYAGIHVHAHLAYGGTDSDGDGLHSHPHVHEGDAQHGHHHGHNMLDSIYTEAAEAGGVPVPSSSSGRSPFSAESRAEFLDSWDASHGAYDDRGMEPPPLGVSEYDWIERQRDRAVTNWTRAWEALKDAEEAEEAMPTRQNRAGLAELADAEATLRARRDLWQARSDAQNARYADADRLTTWNR
jgi:hypothetical protein